MINVFLFSFTNIVAVVIVSVTTKASVDVNGLLRAIGPLSEALVSGNASVIDYIVFYGMSVVRAKALSGKTVQSYDQIPHF